MAPRRRDADRRRRRRSLARFRPADRGGSECRCAADQAMPQRVEFHLPPRVRRIARAALRFVELTRSRALFPASTGRPSIPVSARTTIQWRVAVLVCEAFTPFRQLRDERKFALVLVPNLTRFCFCFADHLCEFAQARTIDPREIAVLGALSVNTGPCCNQRVEICGRVSTIPFDGFGRPRQLKPFGIVRDQTKLLLRYVAIGPGLAFLRQKCDAYQRRQLNVVLGHLLQWRVRVGEPKRARAAALVFISGIAAVRIYFGVDAT